MQTDVSAVPGQQLRKFVVLCTVLIIGSYAFLSYWQYSREFYQDPAQWTTLLQGHGTAPAQYRIGVLFPANFIAKLTHGHLVMRHTLALLDLIFLTAGAWIISSLVSGMTFYRNASNNARCVIHLLLLLLLAFYLSWMFWYHKPETLGNFCFLALAAGLMSGRWRLPTPLAAFCLILISGYLGTIRADAGLALNLGLLLIAFFPSSRSLPLGRITQIVTGILGVGVVLGVESYIKYVLYPHNPFSDGLFQLVTNLKSPLDLFCVVFALTPYFLTVALSRRYWQKLEAWECALILASVIEFLIFFVVARVDEVRLFIPYAMVLLPTAATLLCYELLEEQQAPVRRERI